MAVAALMGALSAGTAALTTGVFAGGFLIAGAGTFMTHFLVTTAMGAALNALSPKPNSGASGGYSLTGVSGSAVDHQIIYGMTKVGGVRIYDTTTGGEDNTYLHRILAYAGHEIESYEEIYLNDELVTINGSGNVTSPARYSGFVRIKRYYGTTTQAADTDLIEETSGNWTSNHKLSNIAYLYIRLKYDSDVFPNGIPVVSCVVKGKKVFDPETSTTAWSDNPALCLRDYISSSYGLSIPTSRIADDLVITAKGICNQTVEGEKRYTCNGSFLTSSTPKQVISNMLTSMGGLFWYSQGMWRMKAAAYVTPTVTLDEDDLRSGISLSTRHSRRDSFNTVKGTFRGSESDWQEADYPLVDDDAFITADNNLVNTVDFSLPFTSSSKTAQRIARVFLNRNREQLTVSATFGLKAFQVEVGDIVYLNNTRFGWSNKPFEVTTWDFGLSDGLDLQTSLTLREISPEVFTNVDGAVFENNNTTLPSPFHVPPISFSNIETELRANFESLFNVVKLTVASPDPASVERVEVQIQKVGDTLWTAVGVGDLGVYETSGLDDGNYSVRVRAYSFLGVKGDWFQPDSFQVVGQASPPQDVTNFSANLSGGNVNLAWTPVTDADLSYYRIRHTTDESAPSWSNAVTYVDKVSRPASSVSVPAKSGTYMIRAYDKLGTNSTQLASIVVPANSLDTFTNNLSLTESPTFSGTKTNTSVVSSNLRITTTTSAPSSGTYLSSTYIDTGAARRVRAYIDLAVSRFDNGSGLFDDLSGPFDSLTGLFDDLTGGGNFDDTDVVTYISITNDNPAGTPTWSAYQIFQAGDFYGRAFRFKVELKSNSVGVSPSISSLVAKIKYN